METAISLPGRGALMRLPEVCQEVGLKRAAIYRHMGRGAFPRPVRTVGRSVRWRRADVEHWIASREAA